MTSNGLKPFIKYFDSSSEIWNDMGTNVMTDTESEGLYRIMFFYKDLIFIFRKFFLCDCGK